MKIVTTIQKQRIYETNFQEMSNLYNDHFCLIVCIIGNGQEVIEP